MKTSMATPYVFAAMVVILLANGVSRFLQRYSQDLLSMLGHGGGERDGCEGETFSLHGNVISSGR